MNQIYTPSFGQSTHQWMMMLLSFLLVLPFLNGQNVNLTKVADVAMQETGANITYTIQGGCSDLVNDCVGAIMVDQLGPNVDFVSAGPVIVNSGPPPGMNVAVPAVYDPMTHQIVWDFTNLPEAGMPDGTSFSIQVVTQIKPGVTPNGATISNTAAINSPASSASETVDVTAVAAPDWSLSKVLRTAPILHDMDETYRITLTNNGGGIGNLNLENAQIVDQLPPGAVYVGSSPMGTYDMGANTVTWNLGDIDITTSSTFVEVTVQFPVADATNNNTGLTMPIPKTNTADFTADPIGEPQLMLQGQVTANLNPPIFLIGIVKEAADNRSIPEGENNYFNIPVSNGSSVPVDDFTLVDEIPNQFNLDSLNFTGFPPMSEIASIRVQRNGSGVWEPWLTNVDLDAVSYIDVVGTFGPDYISMVEINFGTVPTGFSGEVNLVVTPAMMGTPPTAVDNAGDPVGYDTPYTNSATLSAVNPLDMSTIGPQIASDYMCIIPRTARVAPEKLVTPNYVNTPDGVPTTGNPYFTGSRVQFTLHLENDGTDDNEDPILTGATGLDDIIDPVVSDLLPAGLIYEPGSWAVINTASAPSLNPVPTFAKLDDFNSTGDTLLRWAFTGTLAPGEFVDITFNATIDPDLAAFTTLTNPYCIGSVTSDISCENTDCGITYGPTLTTTYDIANFYSDIPTIDEMCCSAVSITVVDSMATLEPSKELLTSGPFAPSGTSLVEVGLATDTAAYQISIGNSDMANFILPNPIGMDLLPEGLDYVDGSLSLVSNSTGLAIDDMGGNPTFEVIRDFLPGRTLLRWRFTGDFPIGSSADFEYKVSIKPGAFGALSNSLEMTTNDFFYNCQAPSSPVTDDNDLDGDADLAEGLCSVVADPILVSTITSLQSTKFVMGANDDEFLRLPNIASTNLGDDVTWRLLISNPGNVTLNNVIIIDVFPYIGDVGVQLNTSDRESEWRPFLTAPITVPANVDLEYSTSENPCRPEINPVDPSGCVNDWSATPPMDLSTVQAIKLELQDPLEPADSILIDIFMEAPMDGVDAGDIAWNSLARNADEVPAQEPNKVGVRLDYFDLALAKTLTSGQSEIVIPGDDVTFDITITNQGSFIADSIVVTDYFPSELLLNDGDWTPTGNFGALQTAEIILRDGAGLPAGGLLPDESVTVPITMTLDPATLSGDLVNYAEISAARDDRGLVRTDDFDSTPDATFGNDLGGTPGVAGEDDEINDDGTTDEDDSDPALIQVGYVDLALTKVLNETATPGPFYPGSEVTFTITVYNQGDLLTADRIHIVDYIPDDMVFVSGTAGSVMTLNGQSVDVTSINSGNFIISELAPGDQVDLSITLRIRQEFTGTSIRNWAEIRAADNDMDASTPSLSDIDSTPNAINFSENGETDDDFDDNETGQSGKTGGDEDDHDLAEITVLPCPSGNCGGVTVTPVNE